MLVEHLKKNTSQSLGPRLNLADRGRTRATERILYGRSVFYTEERKKHANFTAIDASQAKERTWGCAGGGLGSEPGRLYPTARTISGHRPFLAVGSKSGAMLPKSSVNLARFSAKKAATHTQRHRRNPFPDVRKS